ncbi:divergent PAP2 family protein [Candidatus Saccharibacteria bacterium]|nr:divergent PAP2 family protein [Candidatus Saccharibacteria bacterium]
MLNDFLYVITAAGAWLAAQAVKIAISLRQDGLSWQDLVTSGGMPSAHVALVTSMAVVIAMSEGPASPVFGVALTLWGVVVYDAVGVRRATGENTQIIRRIADKLKLGDQRTALHLALGHSPYQVFAGAVLGLGWGWLIYWLLG